MTTEEKIKKGSAFANRSAHALWDSLDARSENELECIIEYAKQCSQTNCGWQEYKIRHILQEIAHEILQDRKPQTQQP